MGRALDQVQRAPVAFGYLIASHVFPIDEVLAGAADLLGEVPLLGFSTSAELSSEGLSRRTVLVALFCGEGIQGRANWWPDFVQDSRNCTRDMLQTLEPDGDEREVLLVVADGLNGDSAYLCEALSDGDFPFAGCLAGGELWRGRTFQLGGRLSGAGGLAAAVLGGDVVIGVGAAHGWQPVGALSRLTHVQAQWVREIDGQQACETYARLFGYSTRQWAYPPLNDLVRLYPLGLQDDSGLVVRSPLRMEADGSLRMNTTLPEGGTVDLLVGTQEACLAAARQATETALASLGPTRPKLALVLVDAAWQAMLQVQPGAEVAVVRRILGEGVPILGGYTFGQMARFEPRGPARLLNQHMLVVLFGEKRVEIESGASQ